tara:strand:+ start:3410 stop:4570 length:1161 start_codon:yes stop_codon:yes gene_type:complete
MNKRRRYVAILGSTGSIGTQTLSVIKEQEGRFKVKSLSAGKNIPLLLKQISEFGPNFVCVQNKKDEIALKKNPLLRRIKIHSGEKGLKQIGEDPKNDILVASTSGINSLTPTIESLKRGKRVCIASKEIYLLFGREISRISKKFSGEIIPIDSEHSALFQLIRNEPKENIRKLYITASGGPFFNKKNSELKNVQPKDALKHPTWNMGKKISIDSATMMNKAIEIIEASIMFDLPGKIVSPVINLESHIHAVVEFVDGNYMISGSHNDMRIPISYSLNYPFRYTNNSFRFKPSKTIELIPIKEKDYKAIQLARKAIRIGGSMPTVMNAANSVAVGEFLNNKIKFLDILKIIEKTMEKHSPKFKYSLKEILKINVVASKDAFDIVNKL